MKAGWYVEDFCRHVLGCTWGGTGAVRVIADLAAPTALLAVLHPDFWSLV